MMRRLQFLVARKLRKRGCRRSVLPWRSAIPEYIGHEVAEFLLGLNCWRAGVISGDMAHLVRDDRSQLGQSLASASDPLT